MFLGPRPESCSLDTLDFLINIVIHRTDQFDYWLPSSHSLYPWDMHTHLGLASGLVFWRFFFFLDRAIIHKRMYVTIFDCIDICRNTDVPMSVTGDILQLYVITKPFQPSL
jgi:hypothetical protein